MYGTARGTVYGYSIWEFQVYGSGGSTPSVVNFDVPGGESGGVNYSGQGAYADAGHNYWNSIVPGGTTAAGTNSDGATVSAVTFTEAQAGDYNDGGPGTQGSPSGLQSYFAYANNSSTQTCTLNHVPAGTYALYLYGINGGSSDCNRGTVFTVSSDLTSAMTNATINTTAAYNTFIAGNDYVVFNNVTVGSGATITIKYTHNPAATGVSGNTEGDFNGVQLVPAANGNQLAVMLPSLSIQPASGAQGLVLQWPDTGVQTTGDTSEAISQPSLYYTTNLVPTAVWTAVTNTPILSNGQWIVTLPAGTNGSGFYRLQ
jgi:hypothetical protein